VADFIQLGIDYFNTGFAGVTVWEEKLEYVVLLDVLEALNKRIYYKIPIYKDATASALQLLLVLLGPGSQKILQEGNLSNAG
jgi:hypothetical protein